MKTLVSSYEFKGNGANIKVYAVEDEEGVLPEDCLSLEITPEGSDPVGVYMRPDEALLIIKCLSEGMFKTIESYEVGILNETS